MMGNWHCVTSGCAEVVYREYLPPVVRWRYEGEDWQEIEADDYTVEPEPPLFLGGQCPDTGYFCSIEFFNPRDRIWKGAFTDTRVAFALYAPITGYELIPTSPGSSSFTVNAVGRNQNGDISKPGFRQGGIPVVFNGSGSNRRTATELRNFQVIFSATGQQDTGTCGNPQGRCTLNITKNGQVVHQETRETCPEVEKLPCRLSDEVNKVKVDKIPYLERVEVVDYGYDVRLGLITDPGGYGLLLSKEEIPSQCLNIYKNNVTATIPNDFFQIANQAENNYQQIMQICSAPGCLPPEYQVLCDCDDCKSCPTGTCAVKCGDNVCCYDTETGKAVTSIPKSNYCEGI